MMMEPILDELLREQRPILLLNMFGGNEIAKHLR